MITLSREDGLEEPEISIYLNPDLLNWSIKISPNEFTTSFLKKLENVKDFHSGKEDESINETTLFYFYIFKDIDFDLTIEENLDLVFTKLNAIISEILFDIQSKEELFSIDTSFSFPEEYKTACEQYLLYFTTFLKDLGIEAKTDLENQENGVLFKVFPQDKKEALTQIKEALAIYLGLPVQQNIDEVATQFPDAAVQQLIANVYHLKSQLVLANSTILQLQRQNEAFELFQYQEKSIIHLGELDKNQKNEEKIFGGIVTVKEYEGTGFNIDLPKLFRMMKRIWNK